MCRVCIYFSIASLLIVLLSFSCVSSSTKMLVDEERVKLSSVVGGEYDLIFYEDSILIKSKKLFYFYSAVSLPQMSKDELEEYAKTSGRKDYYELYITFVRKWDAEKIEKAREKNSELLDEQYGLQEKHGLGHLTRNKLNSFFPQTPEDEAKIKRYEDEYNRINSEMIEIPRYHSKKFSLFVRDNRRGFEAAWSPDSKLPDLGKIFQSI